jgi:hypothetical protein
VYNEFYIDVTHNYFLLAQWKRDMLELPERCCKEINNKLAKASAICFKELVSEEIRSQKNPKYADPAARLRGAHFGR